MEKNKKENGNNSIKDSDDNEDISYYEKMFFVEDKKEKWNYFYII